MAFWTVVGTIVIMAGWSLVTASYFAFQDDVITRLISHQADVQAAYEDRLADMRAQVDRVISRQLLDQEQFERRLDRVVHRQAVLEQRTGALSALGDPIVTGSVKREATKPGLRLPKPSPIRETGTAPPLDKKQLNRLLRPGSSARVPGPGFQSTFAQLTRSLDEVEQRQIASLQAMEERYDGRVRRIHAALVKLGIKPGKAPKAGAGGPFVPVEMADNEALFEQQVRRIRLSRAHLGRLSKTLLSVPVRQPVAGKMRFSSNFGMRLDPFLRRPAMHTGLDFRGDPGDPIRATAIGRVVSARWSGGYGRMIEIDHGKGLSTRYGHLSRILVRKGQRVRIGQTIGKMGSTGRSTGPHLHYETRVDGKAVNPKTFLAAGRRLGLL